MAEERFIDDDKDRKYRIRINEDGEEELEIIEGSEEEEEDDFSYPAGLEVPEFEEDDEEAADMTPEQLFAVRRQREKERAEAEAKAGELIEKAKGLVAGGQKEYALITLDSAQQAYEKAWEVYSMKLELITENFSDFSRLDECADLARNYQKYAPSDLREAFSEKYAHSVLGELTRERAKAESLGAENSQKKQERRVKFKKRFNVCLRNLLYALVPFVILLCVGIGFSTIMFSDRNGSFLVLTIVFFSLAFAALVASVILLRPLSLAIRRIRVNESDSSTAVGRNYIESVERCEKLDALYSAINFIPDEKTSENSTDSPIADESNAKTTTETFNSSEGGA